MTERDCSNCGRAIEPDENYRESQVRFVSVSEATSWDEPTQYEHALCPLAVPPNEPSWGWRGTHSASDVFWRGRRPAGWVVRVSDGIWHQIGYGFELTWRWKRPYKRNDYNWPELLVRWRPVSLSLPLRVPRWLRKQLQNDQWYRDWVASGSPIQQDDGSYLKMADLPTGGPQG